MGKLTTLEQIEEVVNEGAVKYAAETHNLPKHAVRIILEPEARWITHTTRGPTAIIRLGVLPNNRVFGKSLRNAIDYVAKHHLYESMELDLVAHIVKREDNLRRVLREKYNFAAELVPNMLKDHELVVRKYARVEVIHRKTGLREVVEVEAGQGDTFTAAAVARSRLSRRVHQASMEAEIDPLNLPPEHPMWIARTV